jgi:Flp pilus assembly protein TadG
MVGMLARSLERDSCRALKHDHQGVAALEFAVIVPLMLSLVCNVYDFSVYIYDRMQVANASQMGAQAIWQTCDMSDQPATVRCGPKLTTAVTAAVASTSLGSKIQLVAGSPSEGYYCANASNVLQYVGGVSSKPANCSAAGNATVSPGDYVTIQVTYQYNPQFQFPFSLANLLATPIALTSTIRID